MIPEPVCATCEEPLVEQRMPTRLRYGGRPGVWIPENEETFLIHRLGKPCPGPCPDCVSVETPASGD
jgi:hypothetical protein